MPAERLLHRSDCEDLVNRGVCSAEKREGYGDWLRLGIWLVTGLAIYFLYGRRYSRVAQKGKH